MLMAGVLAMVTSLSSSAVKFTISTSVADAVKVSAYVNNQQQEVTLKSGANEFDFPQYTSVNIVGISPWEITGIVNKGGTPLSGYQGSYYMTVGDSDEGQVYTVTLKNIEESRTGSCTVTVDDASLINALYGNYKPVTLKSGTQTLKFDPQTETALLINSNSSKPIYSVTLDGSPVPSTGSGTSYVVALTQGCNINITARIPDKDVTVTFAYPDTDSEGAISSVSVENTPVADFNGKTVNMKAGQQLSFVNNSLYIIDGLQIDGQSQSWSGGYAYSFTVMDHTTVTVKAHKQKTYKVTVNVNEPACVKVYRGYSYNNDVVDFKGQTQAVVEVPETNAIISWEAAAGCYIDGVKVDNQTCTNNSVEGKDGMVIDITAGKIVMDKTGVVWIDDRSAVDTYFSFTSSQTREELGSGFVSGYNEFAFYNGMLPMGLSWYSSKTVVGKVYVNEVLQSPMYEGSTTYSLALADRDVVKLFYANEPVECNVSFEVQNGVNAVVTRDLLQSVPAYKDGFKAFKGTQVVVGPATSDNQILVSVNGSPLTAKDGVYTFTVNDTATKVSITSGSTAIEGVEMENAGTAVYNMQGIKVGDSLDTLPAGLYIVNGKKVRK